MQSFMLVCLLSMLRLYLFAVSITSSTRNLNYYNETDVCVMTRDNVCLMTDIYYPSSQTNKPWTTVFIASPYGKSLTRNFKIFDASYWFNQNYVVLCQDFRGKGHSTGEHSFFRTAANDTLDTVQWMLNKEWSNGYMIVQGVSALALHQYTTPAGITQAYWDGEGETGFDKYNELANHILFGYLSWGGASGRNLVYQNGAFRACLMNGWLDIIGEHKMVDELKKHESFSKWWYPLSGNWTEWNKNGKYDNKPQWAMTNLTMIHRAGWYDIFGNAQIKTALGINETGRVNAKGNQILIIEPGGHCTRGAIRWPNKEFGEKLATKYTMSVAEAVVVAKQENKLFNVHDYVPFNLLFYMLGPGKVNSLSKGNYWVKAAGFPPFESRPFYLNENKQLTENKAMNESSITYTYNPKHSVPTWGGNNLICQPCGPRNQRRVENNRNDILHFTSNTLTNDIYIVGEIIVKLFVSSDCIDTDFTAKLIDIFPDNKKHMLVQDGILRMRWRQSEYQTQPIFMEKYKIYQIEINIGYMSYIFNSGHKISLSISSSNYPKFSINYNSGNMLIDGDKDYKIANNKIYFGGLYDARLILPVVDAGWIAQREVN